MSAVKSVVLELEELPRELREDVEFGPIIADQLDIGSESNSNSGPESMMGLTNS
jgi:hypothetical protein